MTTFSTVGTCVRECREQKEMTRDQLAKRLKISKGYLSNIENDVPVSVSPRLIAGLKKTFNLGQSFMVNLEHITEKHNAKSRKWYKGFRDKAKAAKKVAKKKSAKKAKKS